MDISKFLNLLYRYLWLMVLAALIAGLTTYYQISSQPKGYRASTDVLVGPGLDSANPDLNSLRIGGQMGQTYAEVLSTSSFLEAVNNKLSSKMNLGELDNSITNRQSADTRVLTIIVYYKDPKQAIAIANAAAQTLLEISPSRDNLTASLRAQLSDQSQQLEQSISGSQSRIQQLQTELETIKAESASSGQLNSSQPPSRIQELEAELAALEAAKPLDIEAQKLNLQQQNLVKNELADERDRLLRQQDLAMSELAAERSRLSDTLRTLANIYQILQGADGNQIEIIQPATTAALVDQQLLLKVGSSAVAGLIFAIIIIFVAGYFDDRLRFPDDLSKAAGVPLLGTIDKYPRLNGSSVEQLVTFAHPESAAANKYREVVAKLLFSINESTPYTIFLSSVGSDIGTNSALTAGNLAVAFAQAGYKVMLVDAHFDNPDLTRIFKAERKEGLAEMMTTQSTETGFLSLEPVPAIRFLPVGLSSEKISYALLNPTNVAKLFERLQKEADIVLITGSAISQFAENLTLASQANAVILVAHYATASSNVVNRLVENFRLMKINLAGVIFDYNPSPLAVKGNQKIDLPHGQDAATDAVKKTTLSEQTTKN